MTEKETIVAQATPVGVSAIAVVRVSGPQVRDVIKALFPGRKTEPVARQMVRASAIDVRTGESIDDLMFCFFANPQSYTGEDLLEVFPHGNPVLVRKLVEIILLVAGVRHALPGEFTRRAFLAGKLDLVQAEAVGQLLHASAESALSNARRMLSGRLSNRVVQLTDQVTRVSALMELEVDFAEDETEVDQARWLLELQELENQLKGLQDRFRAEALAERIPLVVFYGAPNAGKSSLVNALVGENRLLVSARAGTTRDSVEVHWILSRGEVRLVDTAGLSVTPLDELDKASQERSRKEMARADVGVLVVDGSQDLHSEDEQAELILKAILEARSLGHWIIWNKKDLRQFENSKELRNVENGFQNNRQFEVSANEGTGLQEFCHDLEDQLFGQDLAAEEFWITSARQQEGITEALQGVQKALVHLQNGRNAPEELAFELALVRKSLENIIGRVAGEEILRAIFSRFCIGK